MVDKNLIAYTNCHLGDVNIAESKLMEDIINILKQHGEPIEFDYQSCDAPSIPCCSFGDDITLAYITKVWVEYDEERDEDLVIADLYAHYLGERKEGKILKYETLVGEDYTDLANCILTYLED